MERRNSIELSELVTTTSTFDNYLGVERHRPNPQDEYQAFASRTELRSRPNGAMRVVKIGSVPVVADVGLSAEDAAEVEARVETSFVDSVKATEPESETEPEPEHGAEQGSLEPPAEATQPKHTTTTASTATPNPNPPNVFKVPTIKTSLFGEPNSKKDARKEVKAKKKNEEEEKKQKKKKKKKKQNPEGKGEAAAAEKAVIPQPEAETEAEAEHKPVSGEHVLDIEGVDVDVQTEIVDVGVCVDLRPSPEKKDWSDLVEEELEEIELSHAARRFGELVMGRAQDHGHGVGVGICAPDLKALEPEPEPKPEPKGQEEQNETAAEHEPKKADNESQLQLQLQQNDELENEIKLTTSPTSKAPKPTQSPPHVEHDPESGHISESEHEHGQKPESEHEPENERQPDQHRGRRHRPQGERQRLTPRCGIHNRLLCQFNETCCVHRPFIDCGCPPSRSCCCVHHAGDCCYCQASMAISSEDEEEYVEEFDVQNEHEDEGESGMKRENSAGVQQEKTNGDVESTHASKALSLVSSHDDDAPTDCHNTSALATETPRVPGEWAEGNLPSAALEETTLEMDVQHEALHSEVQSPSSAVEDQATVESSSTVTVVEFNPEFQTPTNEQTMTESNDTTETFETALQTYRLGPEQIRPEAIGTPTPLPRRPAIDFALAQSSLTMSDDLFKMFKVRHMTDYKIILKSQTNNFDPVIFHVHKVIVGRSPLLTHLIMGKHFPTEIEARGMENFMLIKPMEQVIHWLYGKPALCPQNLRSVTLEGLGYNPFPDPANEPRYTFSLPMEMMEMALSYACCAAFFFLPAIADKGFELAFELLSWETVQRLLFFGFCTERFAVVLPPPTASKGTITVEMESYKVMINEFLAKKQERGYSLSDSSPPAPFPIPDLKNSWSRQIVEEALNFVFDGLGPEFELYCPAKIIEGLDRIPEFLQTTLTPTTSDSGNGSGVENGNGGGLDHGTPVSVAEAIAASQVLNPPPGLKIPGADRRLANIGFGSIPSLTASANPETSHAHTHTSTTTSTTTTPSSIPPPRPESPVYIRSALLLSLKYTHVHSIFNKMSADGLMTPSLARSIILEREARRLAAVRNFKASARAKALAATRAKSLAETEAIAEAKAKAKANPEDDIPEIQKSGRTKGKARRKQKQREKEKEKRKETQNDKEMEAAAKEAAVAAAAAAKQKEQEEKENEDRIKLESVLNLQLPNELMDLGFREFYRSEMLEGKEVEMAFVLEREWVGID